ncbi:MAG: type II toxin-antitoxin system VapB family antitoxin [Pararhizobium sp.]
MNLQIRNPRARELARELARKRNVSVTDAVIGALEAELARVREEKPLAERVRPIVDRLLKEAKPGGRDLTKDEIDAMWGHE